MSKPIGGQTRQKVELEKAINELMQKMGELSAPSKSSMPKRLARIAQSFKVDIGQDKRRKEGSSLSLKSYRTYLSRTRGALRRANYRNSCLTNTKKGALTEAIKAYPEYASLLEQLRTEHAETLGKVMNDILTHVKEDKANKNRAKAYRDIKAIPLEHEIVPFLQLDDIQTADYEDDVKASLETKKGNTVTLPYALIEKIITTNLSSKSYTKRAFALALASGRRAVEILYQASFEATGTHTVLFTGQAKKRAGVNAESFEIYTLIPANDFVSAFIEFRAMPQVMALDEDFGDEHKIDRNIDINLRTAKTLNEAAKSIMNDRGRIFKDSRAIYTRICLDKYWDKKTDEDFFLRGLLGHSDFKAQSHYKQFIVDYANSVEYVPTTPESNAPSSGLLTVQDNKADDKALKRKAKELAAFQPLVDAFVQEHPTRSSMAEYHKKVIEFSALNPESKITQSALSKCIGGNRQTIKDYLGVVASPLAHYNSTRH